MKRKTYQVIIGVGLVVGVLGYLFISSFAGAKVYYYTLDELKGIQLAPDKRVRISGALLKDSVHYDPAGPLLQFILEGKEGTVRIPVTYGDAMPDNFMRSEEVVVTGYLRRGTFLADSMLIKCPSKYETEPPRAS